MPIVTNLQDQVFIDAEMDATALGMGMAHDIGECFLRDSIAGDFHSGWKGRQAFWGSEGEGEAAGMILGELLLQGRQQAEIIQGGWT